MKDENQEQDVFELYLIKRCFKRQVLGSQQSVSTSDSERKRSDVCLSLISTYSLSCDTSAVLVNMLIGITLITRS